VAAQSVLVPARTWAGLAAESKLVKLVSAWSPSPAAGMKLLCVTCPSARRVAVKEKPSAPAA
jgi:hypothetical protein